MEAGMNAVPGIILDGRYLISGAQPAEVLVDQYGATHVAPCALWVLLAQPHLRHERPCMHIHGLDGVDDLLGLQLIGQVMA